MVLQTVACVHCGGVNLRRDGKAPKGKQKYSCHDCQREGRQNPSPRGYSAGFQAQVLAAYHKVLPQEQHQATGEGDGQTYHIDRFNNTLRQRLARFVRKALSFSKCERMHEMCLRLFLHEYNLNCPH